MSLSGVAKHTLKLLEEGGYTSEAGLRVELGALARAAVEHTQLYSPDDFPLFLKPAEGPPPVIELTPETTACAARRLEAEGCTRIAALNFASAKNPGGGFLGGAKAQEEDLARRSGLYPCLLQAPAYYQANRESASALYTDHLIYSPDVPFFRDRKLGLLDAVHVCSVITAPAPNAGAVLKNTPKLAKSVRPTAEARALKVLQVAAANGHRTLVLGAWGCGVFQNNPREIAQAFALALQALAGHFDRVVFAIYLRDEDSPNMAAFREQFSVSEG